MAFSYVTLLYRLLLVSIRSYVTIHKLTNYLRMQQHGIDGKQLRSNVVNRDCQEFEIDIVNVDDFQLTLYDIIAMHN